MLNVHIDSLNVKKSNFTISHGENLQVQATKQNFSDASRQAHVGCHKFQIQ